MSRKPNNPLPSQELLKELFDYDEKTGEFTPRFNLFSINNSGRYKTVWIAPRYYAVHRLIWMWMTGEDPAELTIDHKNGNGQDNRWCNLRVCTQAQNLMNRPLHKRNALQVKGVTERKLKSGITKYRAHIGIDGKAKYIGTYNTIEEASNAYHCAAKAHQGIYYHDDSRTN